MSLSQPLQYLLIDLTHSQSQLLDIPPEVAGEYPSGAALATWLLHSLLPEGTEPLSPDSIVALASGVFSGLTFPGGTRMAVVAKSPLTGLWTGGTMGGEFAWALARSGLAAVVIKGRAPDLSYLLLDEGRVFFRPASRLRARSTSLTRDELKHDWGNDAAVICIGPAGEAQVRFASVHDGSPEPGLRGGLGAVLGSKNLKAMVLRPHQGRSIADPAGFLERVLPLTKQVAGPNATNGSIEVLDRLEKADALPGRNFQGVFKDRAWIEQVQKLPGRKRSCIGCPVSCVQESLMASDEGGADSQTACALFPEHLWALGPLVGLSSPLETARVLLRCLEHGLEPVSFGGVSAWAAETAENGTDLGLEFTSQPGFGQADWLANLPNLLVADPNVNQLLGQGVNAAANKIGGAAIGAAAHYEGLEMTYTDPRRNYLPLSFLGPAFSLFAPLEGNPEITGDEIIKRLIASEDQWALWQTLGICPWAATAQEGLEQILPGLFPLVDGSTISPDTLKGWSKGLIHLIKTFDWREGWRPLNQIISPRFFQEDLTVSEQVFPAVDRKERIGLMKTYFSERGWEEDGRPRQ